MVRAKEFKSSFARFFIHVDLDQVLVVTFQKGHRRQVTDGTMKPGMVVLEVEKGEISLQIVG